MAQLRYEVWSVPGIATFEKKIAGLRPDSASGTLYRRQSGLGQLSIPANYDRLDEIITVDPSNHANDVASLIRVYRGTDLIQELLVPVTPNLVADQPAVLSCAGIEAVMDWAITECWDWDGTADFTSTVPDWIYGGRNLIPDLALGDLGSIREQWELWNDQTPGGTFVLRVTEPAGNPQDTNSLAFDATIQQIEGSNLTGNGLEGLSNVNDVTISGSGTSNDDPWVITFFDPPIIDNLQVFDSGSLVSALSQTVAGMLDPSPVTVSQSIDASRNPNTHGTYTDPPIEVVTTPLDTGADWSLLVNATGQYAGSQIVINGVTPGQTYQWAGPPIRPTITSDFTLVVHDQFENRIKTTSPRDNTLTAGVFTQLSISDIEIPEGVTRVILRAAVTDGTPANIGDYYVNWQGSTFREGQAATTAGQVLLDLLDDAQTDHASGGFPRTTLDFINAGFDATNDTDGVAWADSELSINIPRGMTYRKILDRVFGQLGYEWNLTPTAGTPGEWDLNVWNPDGRGTDHSAADTPSLLLGQGTLGGSATRQIPSANRIISEGAGQFTTRARNTASEGTIGSREWYQADVSYRGAQAEEWTDKTLARFLDVSLQPRFEIADPPDTEWPIPVVDYGLADVLNVDLADGGGKVSRTVEAISWRTIADGIRWGVHTGEAQFDAFPTGGGLPLGVGVGDETRGSVAVAPQRGNVALSGPVDEGVRRLLDQFDRLEDPKIASAFVPSRGGGELTIVVAASNAKDISKEKADYICGGSDDQNIINEAIDRINVNSPQTGRLVLSEGLFSLSARLDVFEGEMQGMGPAQTVLNATGVTVATPIVEIGGTGSIVRDLSVQGTGTGIATSSYESRIVNCWISVSGDRAIESSDPTRVIDCRLDADVGVRFHDAGNLISGCSFTGDIFVDMSPFGSDTIIVNNGMTGSGIDGRILLGTGDNTIIVGNVLAGGIEDSGTGVRNTVIANNAFENPTVTASHAIIDFGGGTMLGVAVTGNVVETGGGNPFIRLGSGSDMVISGNQILSGVTDAVIASGVGLNVAIVDNVFTEVDNGVVTASLTEDLLIAGNFIDSGEFGIDLTNSLHAHIHGNTIYRPGVDTDDTFDGIILRGNSDNNYIHGNLFHILSFGNAARYGVNVSASTCDCNVIVGNRFGDPADYGTDAINDAGTDTQWKYPDDPVYGDNFTDCEPSPS